MSQLHRIIRRRVVQITPMGGGNIWRITFDCGHMKYVQLYSAIYKPKIATCDECSEIATREEGMPSAEEED